MFARTLGRIPAYMQNLARMLLLPVSALTVLASTRISVLQSTHSTANMRVSKDIIFPASTRGIIPANKHIKRVTSFGDLFILVLFFIFMHIIVISHFKGVNFVDKKQSKQISQQIPCALHGSHLCPKPKQCDGIHRLCSKWKDHSGR